MMTVHAPLGALLGALFVTAAAFKILRRREFEAALAGYRLARPRRVVAWAVPLAEAAVGLALLAGADAAAWAALDLLAVFSVALAVELLAGSAPPACGCLPGAGRPGPLSLVRNGVLAATAVAVGLGVEPVLGPGFWTASYVALWIAVAGLAALVLSLYRQVGVLHLRLGPRGAFEHDAEGLPLGEPAPEGHAASLLVFTSPDCIICAQITPGLRALASDHAVAVGHVDVSGDGGRELAEEFRVPGTPYAVYVDADGYVRAKGTINTLEQLEAVVVAGREREREVRPARAA